MAEEWIVFSSAVLIAFGIRKMLFPEVDLLLIVPLLTVSLLIGKGASFLPYLDFKEIPPLLLITRFLVWGTFSLIAIQSLLNFGSYGLFFFLYFILSLVVFPGIYYLILGFHNILPFQIWDKSGSIFLFVIVGSFLWLYGVFSEQREETEPSSYFLYFLTLPFAISSFSILPNPEAYISQGLVSFFAGLFSVAGSVLFFYLSGKRNFSEANLCLSYFSGIAISAAGITALEEVLYPWAFMGGLLFQWMFPILLSRGWSSKMGGPLLSFGVLGCLGGLLPAVLYPAEELPHSFYTMLGVQFLGICSAFLSAVFFGSLVYVFLKESESKLKIDNLGN